MIGFECIRAYVESGATHLILCYVDESGVWYGQRLAITHLAIDHANFPLFDYELELADRRLRRTLEERGMQSA